MCTRCAQPFQGIGLSVSDADLFAESSDAKEAFRKVGLIQLDHEVQIALKSCAKKETDETK